MNLIIRNTVEWHAFINNSKNVSHDMYTSRCNRRVQHDVCVRSVSKTECLIRYMNLNHSMGKGIFGANADSEGPD